MSKLDIDEKMERRRWAQASRACVLITEVMMHSIFRRLTPVLILAMVYFGASGAGRAAPPASPTSNVTVLPGSPVEIAVALFDAWPNIQDTYHATQMAADDHGSIKGFNIQRNLYNAGCSPAEGATAGAAIVANTQNLGVVGTICSSSTSGVAPVLETNQVVLISPANTAPDLYTFGPTIFNRVIPPDPEFDTWHQSVTQLASVLGWEAQFNTLYGHMPDIFAKYAYDATRLLLLRIEQVSVVDGGGNLVIDRAALASAVRSSFDYAGITGQIVLNDRGDRVSDLKESVLGDGFTSPALDERWSWQSEDPLDWSLTANPGFLRITSRQSDDSLLLQPAPQQDYEIRTRLDFTPIENVQFAGLTVYIDENNYLAFGRAFDGSNNIYFRQVTGGSIVGSDYETAVTEPTQTYLRLVRSSGDYSGYFSPDGLTWTLIGAHTIGFDPQRLGLYVSNQYQPVSEIPADFDYFILQKANDFSFLPLISR